MGRVEDAKKNIQKIKRRWKSRNKQNSMALSQASFLIGMLSWAAERDKPEIREAIEVYRKFIDGEGN